MCMPIIAASRLEYHIADGIGCGIALGDEFVYISGSGKEFFRSLRTADKDEFRFCGGRIVSGCFWLLLGLIAAGTQYKSCHCGKNDILIHINTDYLIIPI